MGMHPHSPSPLTSASCSGRVLMEPSHSTPDPEEQKAATGPQCQAVVGKAHRNTETGRNESPPQRHWVHWMMGAHIQALYVSPLLWALGAPGGPGLRCRNRCLGVSPGLNDSELRPPGNRELSLRRCCPPARVSTPKQRELWARRMGAGDEDPVRGTCVGGEVSPRYRERPGKQRASGSSYTG